MDIGNPCFGSTLVILSLISHARAPSRGSLRYIPTQTKNKKSRSRIFPISKGRFQSKAEYPEYRPPALIKPR
jgi:hypothetical protein